MEPQEEPTTTLTLGERCKIVGVAMAFAAVLTFLVYLSLTYQFHTMILKAFSESYQSGNLRMVLGWGTLLVFYLAGLPALIGLAIVIAMQGAQGKRTRLTGWFLKEMTSEHVRERHEKMIQSREAKGTISVPEKMLQSYLSPAVGWAIFMLFLVVGAGILFWAATRPG